MHINEANSVDPVAAGVFAMSSGRIVSVLAVAVALIGIVIGGRALARARRLGSDGAAGAADGPHITVVAIVLGLLSIVLGGLVAATSDGGAGTGNGVGGAVVAMVLGLIGVVLGGLARTRSVA